MLDASQAVYYAKLGGLAILFTASAGFGLSALRDHFGKKAKTGKSKTELWAQRDSCPVFSQIPVVSDRSKPRATWPPTGEPAEALPVQDLMAINGALIRDICYASKLTETEYEAYLLPVIANLAHVVHLLPASAYDHHQGYGGLFVHSLETAYYAANQAKNTIFDRTSTPKEIHWNRRRWILTCILAALVHDAGKPYTDMEVTSKDGKSWTKTLPLLDWLRQENVAEYYVTFLSDRTHNEHVSVAVQKLEAIIPKETFAFIGSTGVGERMQEALRNALNLGAKGGLVGKILAGADGLSREADALRQRQIHPAYKNVAHPQGDPLLKAIRALINSGKWTTNYDEKSQLFNTRQGCFISWTEEAVQQIWNQATALGFTGLPQNSVKIAEILIDSKAAIPNTSEDGHLYSNFWNITPILMKEDSIACLRMMDPNFVYDSVAPAPIECVVEGIPVDEDTKSAWEAKWGCQPVVRLTPEEGEEEGLDEEYIHAEIAAAQEREEAGEALNALEEIDLPPDEAWNEEQSPNIDQLLASAMPQPVETKPEKTAKKTENAGKAEKAEEAPQKEKERKPRRNLSRISGEDIPLAPQAANPPDTTASSSTSASASASPSPAAAQPTVSTAEFTAEVFDRSTKSLADNFPPAGTAAADQGKAVRSTKGQGKAHGARELDARRADGEGDLNVSALMPKMPNAYRAKKDRQRPLEPAAGSAEAVPADESQADLRMMPQVHAGNPLQIQEEKAEDAAACAPIDLSLLLPGGMPSFPVKEKEEKAEVETEKKANPTSVPVAGPIEDAAAAEDAAEDAFADKDPSAGPDNRTATSQDATLQETATVELAPKYDPGHTESSAEEPPVENIPFPEVPEVPETESACEPQSEIPGDGRALGEPDFANVPREAQQALDTPHPVKEEIKETAENIVDAKHNPAACGKAHADSDSDSDAEAEADADAEGRPAHLASSSEEAQYDPGHTGASAANLRTTPADWRDTGWQFALPSAPVSAVASSPVKEEPAASPRQGKTGGKRRSIQSKEKFVQQALDQLLEQMLAGKGELIPDGVTLQQAERCADLSHFEKLMKRDQIDLSFASAVAARRKRKPALLFDLKTRRVFLSV